jgi:phosphoribosyl 1,2-cyclic phosphodiesterase
MEVRPWGTRGSIPSPGPLTAGYGGNTSCVEVRLMDGSLVIVDAGSGIRVLGASLGPCNATLLLSHYHWDHIQGLPFFGPAYAPTSSVQIYGPMFLGEEPEELLYQQMYTPFFPASPSQLRGISGYAVTPEEPFAVGTATVRAVQVSHPGYTLGYRIEDADGSVFVYMSDDEVEIATPEMYAGIVGLCQGADLLLHDCQYFESEYPEHRAWGHSTARMAVKLAQDAGVSQLMTFHHDPSHTDEQVEAVAEEGRLHAGDSCDILIGREGQVIQIGADVAQRKGA